MLVSGDLADHAADVEDERLREMLAPLYELPGNHDEPAALRRHFELPGTGAEPVHYAADVGPLRLIARQHASGRRRRPARRSTTGLARGDAGGRPATPTVLALHHPPLSTGVPAWDAISSRAPIASRSGGSWRVRRILADTSTGPLRADSAVAACSPSRAPTCSRGSTSRQRGFSSRASPRASSCTRSWVAGWSRMSSTFRRAMVWRGSPEHASSRPRRRRAWDSVG